MEDIFGTRREPTLSLDAQAGAYETFGFIRDARWESTKASLGMWLAACFSLCALLAVTLLFTLPEKSSGALIAGTVVGALFWPLVAVAVSSLWDHRRSQKTSVKVLLVSCLILTCLSSASAVAMRGNWQRWLNKENLTAEDFRQQAGQCARARDPRCEEANWQDYARLRPEDANGHANLGMVLNRRGKHDEALIQFRQALDLGEGSYDLFGFYADSLTKAGKSDEAIEWSYKALSALPSLVDVRGRLAKLLVATKRPYEALALLESYDNRLEARGQQPYFAGQRIAIETAIDRTKPDSTVERTALRLPTFAGHFFAPVQIGAERTKAFMVDTGATRMSLSEAALRESKVPFKVTNSDVRMVTADGRRVPARAITIESIHVGRFELKNIQAVTCTDCTSLLGQSVLSMFDMQSSKVQGVEFLTLVRRN